MRVLTYASTRTQTRIRGAVPKLAASLGSGAWAAVLVPSPAYAAVFKPLAYTAVLVKVNARGPS